MNYSRTATKDSPALIVYLLDISKSMGKPMSSGISRIQIVMESLRYTVTEMVQRSLKHEIISPRYKVAVVAYSDEIWDILDGVMPINEFAQKGIPKLALQNRTNPAIGFTYAKKIIQDEINTWSLSQKKSCPAPLVVHMTDGELNEISEDPLPIVREIQSIKVEDGNVLVENIHISSKVKVEGPIESWKGYCFKQKKDDPGLGDPYADKLLECSSPLPETYRPIINRHQGLNLQPGVAMMFPGISPQFVREAFVMNGVSSQLGDQPIIDESQWDEE